jgi:hypothetical protein
MQDEGTGHLLQQALQEEDTGIIIRTFLHKITKPVHKPKIMGEIIAGEHLWLHSMLWLQEENLLALIIKQVQRILNTRIPW